MLLIEIRKPTERLTCLLARITIYVGVMLNLMYIRMGKESRDDDVILPEGRVINRLRRKLETGRE